MKEKFTLTVTREVSLDSILDRELYEGILKDNKEAILTAMFDDVNLITFGSLSCSEVGKLGFGITGKTEHEDNDE